MVPLLAAASALGTVDKVASTAVSAWKQMTDAKPSSASTDASGPESFASLLASHGVPTTGGAPVASATGAASASGHHHGGHHVSKTA